ncbi:MAG: aspartate aminotransferase family protein [Blastocatellia bacterium]|nr:aspartate aminotransferase family protein [Blastocatellia bacterium]
MFVKTYKTLPITITHGAGCTVWDTTGKAYLDLYAGHAVASTGHAHPHVAQAIAGQAQNLIFYSTMIDLEIRHTAAKKLLDCAPAGISHVLFANSGAEANENALKMATLQTGRKKIICFEGGFHGRTLLALNVTASGKYRQQASFLVPDIVTIPFGEIDALRRTIDATTAAVIVEPIQSMAGCRMAAPEFYQELRELTQQHGAYLIFDEVQTGIGRTGSMFFSGRYHVVPDILTLAKGIASGVPLSAVLVSDAVAEKVQYGEFGATYGAGPIAMAAMQATLEVIESEQLLENVKQVSSFLRSELGKLPFVEEVRGLGLLVGVKTIFPAGKVQASLLEQGVIVGTSDDPQTIRLLPPLTLQQSEVERFLELFANVRS